MNNQLMYFKCGPIAHQPFRKVGVSLEHRRSISRVSSYLNGPVVTLLACSKRINSTIKFKKSIRCTLYYLSVCFTYILPYICIVLSVKRFVAKEQIHTYLNSRILLVQKPKMIETV